MTDPCATKVPHTKAGARSRARFLRRQDRGHRKMVAYLCDSCGAWHIGHPIGMHAR